ncbi:PIR protein [Plasmodium yoelii]|uniref:PIR protein n=3 Tax=Plasmodium yoelii TaxID=5861 RepID=A0AAF0AYR0_PLAYO|nr:PIR protein [Plasmodium yoelii]EAA16289.1 putative yir3 protein [Plasmodium yoelii yoelii]WBY55482.1 PIR protein [Plasmodium yoelii yoelii]VTZ74000.1 PIR protein [Plasmodium yoelii]|eukprot:XP_034493398.1 PIR protein [Plasmodium yoelii]
MNKEVCKRFNNVWEWISDGLVVGINTNINKNLKKYCDNGSCDDPFGKVNAGCLYLFDEFFAGFTQFNSVAKRKINIVDYILIWLGYMLNRIKNNENDIIYSFYNTYINNDDKDNKYNKIITGVTGYETYNELVDKKEDLMSIDIKDMSKFYDTFILLCDICTGVNEEQQNCNKLSEKANEFAKKYDELNEDYYNGIYSPYNQLLSTLSDDYYNLKSICYDFPLLPTYSRKYVIKSTLISIGFIFVAVSILLGIAYKYSLLGFRKRSQKQCLRERIKNIKKKLIINKLF